DSKSPIVSEAIPVKRTDWIFIEEFLPQSPGKQRRTAARLDQRTSFRSSRRKFSDEDKREAVRLATQSGVRE
ncbi:MAG: hypothetical protein OSB70_20040, partial [Myxococcota bacterium]|nr:hypothetical protein [Myxococcota bacterium]